MASLNSRTISPTASAAILVLGHDSILAFPHLMCKIVYNSPAILKVAELVGGIGLGTGFRSANRSVAGRASPALWGWGSALAGDPGSWCRRAALRPAGRPAAWACIAASRSWCRRAALRPAGAGAAGWELVGGRAVMQGWARGTGPAAVPRAASPATRSSAGNRRTWSGSARRGRNRAA